MSSGGMSDEMKEKIGANPTDHAERPGETTKETRPMCVTDQFLRRHGFQIHSRPKDGEAVWIRGGRTYIQSLALVAAEKLENHAKRQRS